MDKLTDFLTVFFVNNGNEKSKNKKKKSIPKKVDKQTSPKKSEMTPSERAPSEKVQSEKVQSERAPSEKAQSEKVQSEKAPSEMAPSEMAQSEMAQSEKAQSEKAQSEKVKSEKVKSERAPSEKVQSEKVKSEKVKSEKVKSDKLFTDSQNEKDSQLFSSSSVSSVSSVSESSEIKTESSKSTIEIKKYILKPSEFYKKNILITNDNKKDHVDVLGKLLHKLGLLKDISNIYNNDLFIFTQNENKKMFKQMLLDNPYLYFTNFNVKEKLTIPQNINSEKRTICIIDINMLNNVEDIDDFINPNIHLFLLSSENQSIYDYYNKLGEKRLLIHKQNKLKSLQKRFFKFVIKKLELYKNIEFNEYYTSLNNENIDINYIILKEDDLRYN